MQPQGLVAYGGVDAARFDRKQNGFVCVGALSGVWGNMCVLVAAVCCMRSFGGVCGVSWVLCENCIVDASIFLFCEVCVCLGSRALFVSSCCELVYVVMLARPLWGVWVWCVLRAYGGCLGMLGR